MHCPLQPVIITHFQLIIGFVLDCFLVGGGGGGYGSGRNVQKILSPSKINLWVFQGLTRMSRVQV